MNFILCRMTGKHGKKLDSYKHGYEGIMHENEYPEKYQQSGGKNRFKSVHTIKTRQNIGNKKGEKMKFIF